MSEKKEECGHLWVYAMKSGMKDETEFKFTCAYCNEDKPTSLVDIIALVREAKRAQKLIDSLKLDK